MDKKALQEQFEDIAIQNCWNINKYPAGWDGHGDNEYADEFVNGAWWGFKHQQAKVEQLKGQLERAGFTDNGGELMKPPIGMPPRFDLFDDLKNSISEMAQKYRAEAHELSRIRDFEKSQMYSHFANELDRLNQGGA